MQALWLAFDEIAGKGIDIFFIFKFLWYLALILTPTALPIGILLSSIVALGNLAENYEFAAIKSAGVSLKRIIRPLVILTVFLSALNFVFLNNVYPWATLKQKNLYLNIKKKKPSLALAPGVFNTEIPDISIKFDEKFGEEENLLKNVQIADLSQGQGKVKVITAEKGEISSEEGSKYMTLKLENGNYYEDYLKSSSSIGDRSKMPASRATFKTYTINIDISDFSDSGQLNDTLVREYHGMLTIKQLDSFSKKEKTVFDERVSLNARYYYDSFYGKELYKQNDSIAKDSLNPLILENFNLVNKELVVSQALENVRRIISRNDNQNQGFKEQRKLLNLYDFELSHRIAFSMACLVLFFIGAPLGSIIRKGGFGLPMIMAITIFVIYFFITQLGRNLSEESAISTLLGSWLSTLILLPFGFFLTKRATAGVGIFNIDSLFDTIKRFFSKYKKTE
jgi:lipopolysaccharide export system permease protein